MSDQAPLPPINGAVTVALPIARAFEVFTGSISTWWPHQYHIGQVDIAAVVLEPHVGGRWFEQGVDGSECDWGRVLAWEPPQRVVFTWQINGMWQFDPDRAREPLRQPHLQSRTCRPRGGPMSAGSATRSR